MPRKPRFFLPDVPCHIIQRGNNRQAIFFERENYQAYLDWLSEALHRYECALHAYVLMTNHVHLMITPNSFHGISQVMQYLGRHYVPYINNQFGRCGTLWESRFKASLIDSESYLFACMRYIELNPVRAHMVKAPGQYEWSSYMENAYESDRMLLRPHEKYLALGMTNEERKMSYRELFRSQIDEEDVYDIRCACQTGTPLGDSQFKQHIELTLNAKVGYRNRGRPKKKKGL